MPDARKSGSPQRQGLFGLPRARQSKEVSQTASSANALLGELTTLSQKIAAHAIRLQIGEVVTQARWVLNYLQSQAASITVWQDYVRDCLCSAVEATRPFATLYSHLTEPTDPKVACFNDFLTALSHTLSNLHAKLTTETSTSGNSGIAAYKSTLLDINVAYSESGKIE